MRRSGKRRCGLPRHGLARLPFVPGSLSGSGGAEIVKERPILFSAPMVRAILDGSKMRTRRAVDRKWQHFAQCIPMPESLVIENGAVMDFPGRTEASFVFHNGIPHP